MKIGKKEKEKNKNAIATNSIPTNYKSSNIHMEVEENEYNTCLMNNKEVLDMEDELFYDANTSPQLVYSESHSQFSNVPYQKHSSQPSTLLSMVENQSSGEDLYEINNEEIKTKKTPLQQQLFKINSSISPSSSSITLQNRSHTSQIQNISSSSPSSSIMTTISTPSSHYQSSLSSTTKNQVQNFITSNPNPSLTTHVINENFHMNDLDHSLASSLPPPPSHQLQPQENEEEEDEDEMVVASENYNCANEVLNQRFIPQF